ncbi:diaminopimelate decarboxylase [Cognatiyoonia sediminum]|uniref:Diaminopimelate decarboxylase n=1 Tax=Cognatiyoonia sediminum TaxID=1508389 RepID=A0A1M5PUD7_9RHOB|nr:diaminopimelate decarboxylase [Cognatiyoonia sediminum]
MRFEFGPNKGWCFDLICYVVRQKDAETVSLDHFLYRNGVLHAEDVPVAEIAAAVGTPFYVYSTATLQRHFKLFDDALEGLDHLVCFAMKSLSNQAVLKVLADAGAGMDVVSVGEYMRAKAAGVPGEKIVFSGVGKTAEEMRIALEGGIRQFNVESEPEMLVLSRVASELGVVTPITVRVNPDVDAKTHAKIATGKSENKFGIPISRAREVYAMAAELPGLKVIGIDVHIGSQLTELEPFELAYQKVAELTEVLRADGHEITRLDLGGGLGIPYARSNEAPPLPMDYGALIKRTVGHLGCEVEIEPGRLISGNAGLMVSKVIYVKEGEDRKFLIIDGAMNDLIRPAMYEAHHDIVPVVEPEVGAEPATYDIVGPVCESGDTFAKGRTMAAVESDDLIAFRSAGAYGAVMASEYNSRPLIPEVLVHGDQFAVIRPRPTFDEMIARDTLPEWL